MLVVLYDYGRLCVVPFRLRLFAHGLLDFFGAVAAGGADTAAEIESFSVTLPFPLTASTETPYRLALRRLWREYPSAATRYRSRLPELRGVSGCYRTEE